MATQGTYYIGRVLKLGLLDQDKLIDAIKKPSVVHYRGNAWTFIDVKECSCSPCDFIFGKLIKFAPEGEVTVVDTVTHSERVRDEPNLRIASSSFVYIPEHSGIVFLQVYNHIEKDVFIKRFCDIVEAVHQKFFVDCNIELVSDLKTFAAKLSRLDSVFQIAARISPPNPLFSPLWASLKEYLIKRNTDTMSIIENAPEAGGLHTDLPKLVQEASKQSEDKQFIPEEQPGIGDAAILMAADGYGNGRVKGRKDHDIIVIKTSETAMNFSFDKEPDPYELYSRAVAILDGIEKARHMEHGQ